jgi:hypothetical protein
MLPSVRCDTPNHSNIFSVHQFLPEHYKLLHCEIWNTVTIISVPSRMLVQRIIQSPECISRTKNDKYYNFLPLGAMVLLSSESFLSFVVINLCTAFQWVFIIVCIKCDLRFSNG